MSHEISQNDLDTHVASTLELISRRPGADYFIERRFKATDSGKYDVDELEYRGFLRDHAPDLSNLLQRSKVLVLGEPGSGKSTIAYAAAERLAKKRALSGVPIFISLRSYSGDLGRLLSESVSGAVLQATNIRRVYLFDGIDEVPADFLRSFAKDISVLLDRDAASGFLMTCRQAFYVEHSTVVPAGFQAFHLSDFENQDIRKYADEHKLNSQEFWDAVAAVDCIEEVRNPFTLRVVVSAYRAFGKLHDTKSENLSLMIDELIRSRKALNPRRQRRAIKMLAIAMEACSRNELTIAEARQVLIVSGIEDKVVDQYLDELFHSILLRTANGLAFQARSYGEYLAAEELEGHSIDRLRQLAFLPNGQPNDSWMNTISYLAELNPKVRKYFLKLYPTWLLSSSPAAFSAGEKDELVNGVLAMLSDKGEYLLSRRDLRLHKLARFLTDSTRATLHKYLKSNRDDCKANALVLLGRDRDPSVVPVALPLVLQTNRGGELRYCSIVALLNAGDHRLIDELIAALNPNDPFYSHMLDCIGSLSRATDLQKVLPLVLNPKTGLSSTFYHFEELASREGLIEVLKYLGQNLDELNDIRGEGYLKPIIAVLKSAADDEITSLCSDLLIAVEKAELYLDDRSGIAPVLIDALKKSGKGGEVCSKVFLWFLATAEVPNHIDEFLVDLLDETAAQWLIENNATEIIKRLSWMITDDRIRDILRPYSDGTIDAQDRYREERRAEDERKEIERQKKLNEATERMISSEDINEVLVTFAQTQKEQWPEVSTERKAWLADKFSELLRRMDLDNRIVYIAENSWQEPQGLRLILQLIRHYMLRIKRDAELIKSLKAWPEDTVSTHANTYGLSPEAERQLQTYFEDGTLNGTIIGHLLMFLDETDCHSAVVIPFLEAVMARTDIPEYEVRRAVGLRLKRAASDEAVEKLRNSERAVIRDAAFPILVEQQHRPTIERALQALLDNPDNFKAEERPWPSETSLNWIGKIREGFAWDKLKRLRRIALKEDLPTLASLITETMGRIDKETLIKVMEQQIGDAPPMWRQQQLNLIAEYGREVRILRGRNTPFDQVIARLKTTTSMITLKVWCEGSTDLPVFSHFLEQYGITGVVLDEVGGWPHLMTRDPARWQDGCHQAFIVMDGDNGRDFGNPKLPPTDLAKKAAAQLNDLPITFRILKRYGIENYFSKEACEAVLGRDLKSYFPLPIDVSIAQHLVDSATGKTFFSKGMNKMIAEKMHAADISETDLDEILREIQKTAEELSI